MNRMMQFLDGVRSEFAKVLWPTMGDLISSTGVVIALVIVFALYLGALDFCFTHIIGKILSL